jgi:8-oxo-dGTP pyrophosphatase MutT (NUDIX family)
MTDYVVGFLFNPDATKVVLMEKRRPDWQVGKLNGPGGKIRDGESPYEAMEREFREETGAHGIFWRPFCHMKHRENTIIFFTAKADVEVKTVTDEPVRWYDMDDDMLTNVLPNCFWLLPLALDKDGVTASVVDPS